jgi:hypothetical protein
MIVTVVSFGGSARHVRRFSVVDLHTVWCEDDTGSFEIALILIPLSFLFLYTDPQSNP